MADVSTLQPENLAFLGALAVGMLVAQRLFGLDVPKGSEPQSAPSEGEPAV